MSFDAATLYALLPAYLRLRDAAAGGPLQDLMGVLAGQVAVLEEDLAQSYDNLFIETCADWVVPYIGDLVQTTPLSDAGRATDTGTAATLTTDLQGPIPPAVIGLRARADVANTIHYRRRKTTLPMLEQLASDVTGWAAHVREFFTTLAWSQAVRNHVRPDSFYAPDLRSPQSLARIDGPFDTTPRVVDVRPPSQLDGWHNIRNVGVFLWRLHSNLLDQSAARLVSGTWGFAVSPLGQPTPLFARWRRNADATLPSAEPLLPGPIRSGAFFDDLASGAPQFYGPFGTAPAGGQAQAPGASLFVVVDGAPVPPDELRCVNLATWRQPLGKIVGVDVERGRLALGLGFGVAKSVHASWFQGFPADLGGGSYDRQAWLLRRDTKGLVVFTVRQDGGAQFTTLNAALAQAVLVGTSLIVIEDSQTYAEALTIPLSAGAQMVIEAADGERPHLRLTGPLALSGPADAALTLSGLLVEGAVQVGGALGRLRVLHSTLVPGSSLDPVIGAPTDTATPSIAAVSPTAPLAVELMFCIAGKLQIPPAQGSRVWVLDSVVDGLGGTAISGVGTAADGSALPSATAWVERSTIFGACAFQQLLSATEALFTGKVTTLHRQSGCVRFSFVPDGSTTPRRYRCQPDLAIAAALDAAGKVSDAQKLSIHVQVVSTVLPSFTSLHYGDPAYAQLALGCVREIAQGAGDGSDMGVYCHLRQPQRLQNLKLRLGEYLPFGREAAIVFQT